jgi:hypothetical protein
MNQPKFKSELFNINPAAVPCELYRTCPDFDETRHHCTDSTKHIMCGTRMKYKQDNVEHV